MIKGKLFFSLAALPPSCCQHQTHINTHAALLRPHHISLIAEHCECLLWAHFSLYAILCTLNTVLPYKLRAAYQAQSLSSLPPSNLPLPRAQNQPLWLIFLFFCSLLSANCQDATIILEKTGQISTSICSLSSFHRCKNVRTV